jgi:protein-tyrosine phosphatase
MLRQVALPSSIPAALFLTGMPGRYENLDEVLQDVRDQAISLIVCLAPLDEIREKSPQYYNAVTRGAVSCSVEECPVPDRGTPEDEHRFLATVEDAAGRLRAGERVLVHCGAGIGRTGMFATCTLVAVGVFPEVAERAVRAAGSHPETPEQHAFVKRVSTRLRSKHGAAGT